MEIRKHTNIEKDFNILVNVSNEIIISDIHNERMDLNFVLSRIDREVAYLNGALDLLNLATNATADEIETYRRKIYEWGNRSKEVVKKLKGDIN